MAQLVRTVVFTDRHVRHHLRPNDGTMYERTWCGEPLYMHTIRSDDQDRDYADCLRCAQAYLAGHPTKQGSAP